MYLPKLINLLISGVFLAGIGQAILIDHFRGINEHRIQQRQRAGGASSSSTMLSSSELATTAPSSSATSNPSSSTPTTATSTGETQWTTTTAPTSSTALAASPTTSIPTTSTMPSATSVTITPSEASLLVSTSTQIVIATNSDGSQTTYTTVTLTTATPGLVDWPTTGPSGMSDESKNVVMGFAAIFLSIVLIGSIGFLIWKFYFNLVPLAKLDTPSVTELGDYEDLEEGKPGSNPFEPTLESNRAQTPVRTPVRIPVNTSSNF